MLTNISQFGGVHFRGRKVRWHAVKSPWLGIANFNSQETFSRFRSQTPWLLSGKTHLKIRNFEKYLCFDNNGRKLYFWNRYWPNCHGQWVIALEWLWDCFENLEFFEQLCREKNSKFSKQSHNLRGQWWVARTVGSVVLFNDLYMSKISNFFTSSSVEQWYDLRLVCKRSWVQIPLGLRIFFFFFLNWELRLDFNPNTFSSLSWSSGKSLACKSKEPGSNLCMWLENFFINWGLSSKSKWRSVVNSKNHLLWCKFHV